MPMIAARCRQGWIDISKALAIYLVVLGHLDQSDVVSSFLWTFHVPLFFFVSGYLTRASTPREFIKRLGLRLALPYVVLYVANVILSAVISGQYEPVVIRGELLGILYGTHAYSGFINAALWFLPALMIVESLYHLVVSRFQWAFVPIVLLSYALYRSGQINLWFSVDLALLGLNYFVAGALLKRLNVAERLVGRSRLVVGITFLAAVLTMAAATIGNVWYTGPHYVLSVGAAFAGIIMVIGSAWLIDPWLQQKPDAARVVRFVSENTLFILCFHQFSAALVTQWLPRLSFLPWLLESAVITALAIAILAPFNLLVLRWLPEAIGVRRKRVQS